MSENGKIPQLDESTSKMLKEAEENVKKMTIVLDVNGMIDDLDEARCIIAERDNGPKPTKRNIALEVYAWMDSQ